MKCKNFQDRKIASKLIITVFIIPFCDKQKRCNRVIDAFPVNSIVGYNLGGNGDHLQTCTFINKQSLIQNVCILNTRSILYASICFKFKNSDLLKFRFLLSISLASKVSIYIYRLSGHFLHALKKDKGFLYGCVLRGLGKCLFFHSLGSSSNVCFVSAWNFVFIQLSVSHIF